MKQTAIVYHSRHGHTKTYAEWLAKALGADLLTGCSAQELAPYHTLVFGGGLYAGGIGGIRLLTRHFDALRHKNLVVFTVGLADPRDPSIYSATLESTFSPEMREQIRFFHLRGGIDYRQLGLVHRCMMAMMRRVTAKKENKTEQDRQMLQTYGRRVDFLDQASIAPILAHLRAVQEVPPC